MNPSSPNPAKTPVASIPLVQYSIPDPYLRCTAWTFVAPYGWDIRGGVGWTGHLSPAYYTTLSVRNPHGSEEFTFFPVFIFSASSSPFMPAMNEVRPLTDPATCIREVLVPRCRPEIHSGRAVSTERLPDLEKAARERCRMYGMAGAQADAARLLLEYTLGSFPVEEMYYCTTVASQTMAGVIWCIDRAFSYRAEKGKLQKAFPLLGTIAASMQENPQWVQARQRELSRLVAAMSPPPRLAPGGGGPSILDVSRKMARDQDDFLRGVDQSFAARLNSPGLDAWSQAFRGVSPMENPVTGQQIDVHNGYLRYFEDNLGRVYGSNDMIGDPYVNYHINATELQPRQR